MCLLEDLYSRLGKPAPTDEEERAQAWGAIYDALAVVSTYGKTGWFSNPGSLPPGVKAVLLAVAERKVRNPEGYVSETAGEYSYRRPEQSALGLGLTAGEIALIEKAMGVRGLRSVQLESAVRITHTPTFHRLYRTGRW
ncbi:hypothetical protein ACN20G_29860 (plasmid) [Streptomyces sp. BI20]|uniref:hypothetical protein n=1 Tax=Streptomyces sp. BI20 TaxID=3403460 RepID=UPI003C72363E